MHVSFFCLSIMFCLSYLCVPARSVPFQRYIYGRGHLELLLHAAKLGKSCNSSSYLLKVYAIACINFKMMSIRINSLPQLQVRGRNRSDSFFLILVPSIKLSVWCGVWCISAWFSIRRRPTAPGQANASAAAREALPRPRPAGAVTISAPAGFGCLTWERVS